MDVSAVAEAFVSARRTGAGLDHFPGDDLPADLQQAYAIQDAAIDLWGAEPAGWKAGLIAPERRSVGGDERLVGPIWQSAIRRAAAGPVDMPVFEAGFAAVEAEFVVRLDVAVEPGEWAADAVAKLPHTIFAGIEIASSPLSMINDLGPAVTASDFGNNGGLLLGPELPAGSDPALITVRTEIDSAVVGQADGSTIPGGVLTSVAQTLSILGRRGRSVSAGSYLATGAVTGVHGARVGASAVVTFGDLAPLRCRLTAYREE